MKLRFHHKNKYKNFTKNLYKVIKHENKIHQSKCFEILEKYIKDVDPSLYLYSHPYLKFFDDDTECRNDYSRNPWEMLRTEFLNAMTRYPDINVRGLCVSYAWFCTNQRVQDWLKK